jgi:UDP-N-acetylmuramyl pentapeptide synthase
VSRQRNRPALPRRPSPGARYDEPGGSDLILERMMTLHPKVIDLTLDRVHRLLAALGHPERQLPPVIHIAGTNGKGSTQAMIRAGLEAGGRPGARLYLAASGAVSRTHPAGRGADFGTGADRASG